MALTLIVGSANSGKSGLVFQALETAARKSTPALVLPTAPDTNEWASTLAERGVVGVGVVTFDEWLRRLWTLHGDGRRIIGLAARTALVRAAIESEDTSELGESATSEGLPLLIADVVRSMPRAPLRTGDAQTRAIAAILERYRLILHDAGLIERAEAAHRLAEAPPDLPGPAFVSRFTDLDPVQESLLVALARSADVTVTLPWARGSAASMGIEPLVERLMASAAQVVDTGGDTWSDQDLKRFGAAIFEGEPPLPVCESVQFAEASGVEAECALVAHVVGEAVRETPGPVSIAITFRDVPRRLDALAAALDAEGVVFTADVRLPFARSPLGAAVLSGLNAVAGRGGNTASLSAFLGSPYSGADASWVADTERAWRRQAMSPHAAFEYARAQASGQTGAILANLRHVGTEGVGRASVREWQELVIAMLQNAVTAGQGVSAVDASAQRALLGAVDELNSIGGATESELITALRSAEVSTGTGRGDGVIVTEAHRLKGRRFDMVVVGGLTAEEFSPEPRESLAASLVVRLGSRAGVDERLQERAVFHAVITRARRQLVLVRQAFNERGEPLRPSAFWDAALDVYRSTADSASGRLPAGLTVRTESLADLEHSAPAYLEGRHRLRRSALTDAPRVPSRGVLADPDVLRALSERDEYSISEVETYLTCPYRWFLERAVRPRAIDATFDVRERGSLAHQVLATFYGRWRSADKLRVTPADRALALETARSVASELVAAQPAVASGGLAEELDAATAVRWALDAVSDDADLLPGFEPVHHEFAFGHNAGRPVALGGVALKGFIDRIDEGRDGSVVTDYKAARTVPGRVSFEAAGALQVPLYAAAVRQLTGRRVVGALYRSLSSRTMRGVWVGEVVDLGGHGSRRDAVRQELFDEEVEQAIERLARAVLSMRSGDIAARPKAGACRSCAAAVWCGEARA